MVLKGIFVFFLFVFFHFALTFLLFFYFFNRITQLLFSHVLHLSKFYCCDNNNTQWVTGKKEKKLYINYTKNKSSKREYNSAKNGIKGKQEWQHDNGSKDVEEETPGKEMEGEIEQRQSGKRKVVDEWGAEKPGAGGKKEWSQQQIMEASRNVAPECHYTFYKGG